MAESKGAGLALSVIPSFVAALAVGLSVASDSIAMTEIRLILLDLVSQQLTKVRERGGPIFAVLLVEGRSPLGNQTSFQLQPWGEGIRSIPQEWNAHCLLSSADADN